MKKTNLFLLVAASMALLASCNSNPSSSEISTSESSSVETVYTFDDAVFAVAPDYGNGTKVAYPSATPVEGNAPAITDLMNLEDLCLMSGYDSVRAGSTITLNGKFFYVDGKYISNINEGGGQSSYEMSMNVKFAYAKATNTFAMVREAGEDAPFFASFSDATKYQYLIGANGALSTISSLEDGTQVLISFPGAWFEKGAVGDFKYVGVYSITED